MSVPAFDTLKFTKSLQGHEFSARQAEGLAEGIVEIYNYGFDEVRQDIERLDKKMEFLDKKVEALDKDIQLLDKKIDQIDKKFEVKIADLKFSLVKWVVGSVVASTLSLMGSLGFLMYRLVG